MKKMLIIYKSFIIILIVQIPGLCLAIFTTHPENITVFEHESVRISCSYIGSNSPVSWRINGMLHLWFNHDIPDIYEIQRRNGYSELRITSVDLALNNTTYRCVLPTEQSDIGTLYVITAHDEVSKPFSQTVLQERMSSSFDSTLSASDSGRILAITSFFSIPLTNDTVSKTSDCLNVDSSQCTEVIPWPVKVIIIGTSVGAVACTMICICTLLVIVNKYSKGLNRKQRESEVKLKNNPVYDTIKLKQLTSKRIEVKPNAAYASITA